MVGVFVWSLWLCGESAFGVGTEEWKWTAQLEGEGIPDGWDQGEADGPGDLLMVEVVAEVLDVDREGRENNQAGILGLGWWCSGACHRA